MITPEEFTTRWLESDLVRNTVSAFEDLKVPEEARRFLVEAGLPREAGGGLNFERPEGELWRLWDTFHGKYRLPEGDNRFLMIGVDAVKIVCIDEEDGGRIYAVDPAGHYKTCLMNSGVAELAECLLADQEPPPYRGEPTDKQLRAYVHSIEEEMRRADPKAMGDPDNYWPQVLEGYLT